TVRDDTLAPADEPLPMGRVPATTAGSPWLVSNPSERKEIAQHRSAVRVLQVEALWMKLSAPPHPARCRDRFHRAELAARQHHELIRHLDDVVGVVLVNRHRRRQAGEEPIGRDDLDRSKANLGAGSWA